MERPASPRKRSSKGAGTTANVFVQAAIMAVVALFFAGVIAATYGATDALQHRAVAAKTAAYNHVLQRKQADTCGVSHSFTWSLISRDVKSNQQYCVVLAKQVEARSNNPHLRRVYCERCPSTCLAWHGLCSHKACYAPPTVPAPRYAQAWPVSCAHVPSGTTCTSTCHKGYKPAIEGSFPSTTCMTGDIAGESPYLDAWSPVMGSCVPDRLELRHIIKAMNDYHIHEAMACIVWLYSFWFLRAFGLSSLTGLVDIRHPLFHSTVVNPDLWTRQCIVQLVSTFGCIALLTFYSPPATAAATAAIALAASWLLPLTCTRLCELLYAVSSYAAYHFTLLVVQPAIAVLTWISAYTVGPIFVGAVVLGMQLLQNGGTQWVAPYEMNLDFQLSSVPGEATIMDESIDESAVPPARRVRQNNGPSWFAGCQLLLFLWAYRYLDGALYHVHNSLVRLGLIADTTTYKQKQGPSWFAGCKLLMFLWAVRYLDGAFYRVHNCLVRLGLLRNPGEQTKGPSMFAGCKLLVFLWAARYLDSAIYRLHECLVHLGLLRKAADGSQILKQKKGPSVFAGCKLLVFLWAVRYLDGFLYSVRGALVRLGLASKDDGPVHKQNTGPHFVAACKLYLFLTAFRYFDAVLYLVHDALVAVGLLGVRSGNRGPSMIAGCQLLVFMWAFRYLDRPLYMLHDMMVGLGLMLLRVCDFDGGRKPGQLARGEAVKMDRAKELDEPLCTIAEGDEAAAAIESSVNLPAIGACSSVAAAASAGNISSADVKFAPLISFGSDVGVYVQLAVGQQSPGVGKKEA